MSGGLSVSEVKSIPARSFKSLVNELKRFQASLSSETEVGIFANGAGLALHVESVRTSGQMLIFDGVDSNARQARIIQHYTQVSVQVVAVNKLQPQARRIGF
ncbi:MAG: hypothetical protein ACJ8EL_15765 [Rhizomicrobium sp.]